MLTCTLDGGAHCTYQSTYSSPCLRGRVSSLTWSRGAWTDRNCASRTDAHFDAQDLLLSMSPRKGHVRTVHVFGQKGFVFPMSSAVTDNRGLGKLLYSVAETAVLLSCSRSTVYGLIKSGEILAIYPTSAARISASALERYIEKKEEVAFAEREIQRRMTR